MKKFTVYEIEKMMDGKLSKYKINQAIEKGELSAQKVRGDKKGRGVPKYYISEDELNRYFRQLENREEQKRSLIGELKELKTPKDDYYLQLIDEIKKQKDDILTAQNEKFDELMGRIQYLESINIKETPKKSAPQSKKPNERKKEIIAELADMSVFSVKKRKALLEELNQLVG